MPKLTPIQRLLSLYADSPTRVAAALGDGILRQHVEHWLRAGRVPADKCPLIERATRGAIRCEDLRPDVAWDVLRMQAGEACPETGERTAANHPYERATDRQPKTV